VLRSSIKRFGVVTVLNVRIYQIMQKVETAPSGDVLRACQIGIPMFRVIGSTTRQLYSHFVWLAFPTPPS
jgi:hypothetical protein